MRNDAPFDLAVTGGMVVIPPAGPRPLTVGIMGQRIAALVDPGEPVSARAVVDASGQLVLPGAIDPHVHIGYSGYQGMPVDALASHFETESASALIGGVTSIVVTYRNADPYDGLFSLMREAGEKCSRIDFAYSLGITNDEHLHRIRRYHETLGVTSFKFYMAYRGEEARATGNVYNRYDDGLLFEGMEQIAQVPGGIVMVHPENVEIINRLRARLQAGGRNDLAAWSDSRPPFTEAENVRRALYLAEQVGCEVYIPHLSSAEALEAVIEHRARRTTPVTVETCPHYLTHTKHSACGALAKVNPPLREAEDMDRLWQALAQGDVDTIGTDHCAVTRDTKRPDIWGAVPGFPGMATMLPVLLRGVGEGRLSPLRVAEIASYNTARAFGLFPRKGVIAVGSDADLVVVDLARTQTVTAGGLRSRSDFSLYEGQQIRGWPTVTITRGVIAMRDGDVLVGPGGGRYLARGLPAAGAGPDQAGGAQ
jgi:dihydropyrimidinase